MKTLLLSFIAILISSHSLANTCSGYGVYQSLSELSARQGHFYNCEIDMNLQSIKTDEGSFDHLRIFIHEHEHLYVPLDNRAYLHMKWPSECKDKVSSKDKDYLSLSKTYRINGEIHERFISLKKEAFTDSIINIRFGERHYPTLNYRHIAVCGPYN